MIDIESIDRLADRVSRMIPPGLDAAREDISSNVRDVLMRGLRELHLSTREEFDVQVHMLGRTQERLGELEARLEVLEARLSQ